MRITIGLLVLLLLAAGGVTAWHFLDVESGDTDSVHSFSAQEAGFESAPAEESDGGGMAVETEVGHDGRYTISELRDWERPDGPLKVALQVGHLRNDEVPKELSNLTRNGAGATYGNLTEREAVQEMARLTAARLRAEGIETEILPTTVPPEYYADAFVSIHADGNNNENVRGFKTAHFSHDYSGTSQYLESDIAQAYARSTELPEDSNITYYMTGYYAFNWWRYEHALHPMTPAIILETGFITNAADRSVIVDRPERAAEGIARGIQAFFNSDARRQAVRKMIDLTELPLTGKYVCLEGEWDANDPVDERGAPCRPGVISDSGDRYGLTYTQPVVATSSVTVLASGTPVTVDGVFKPMVATRDLSWYDYHVRGVIDISDLTNIGL